MNETQTYSINIEDNNIVLRLKGDMFDEESLVKLLDYLELESIRRRSSLSAEVAQSLADEIDGEVWEKVKVRIPGA
ncbi:MAG: hypothetical protein AB7H86_17880 [Blastocatellales bacterium]